MAKLSYGSIGPVTSGSTSLVGISSDGASSTTPPDPKIRPSPNANADEVEVRVSLLHTPDQSRTYSKRALRTKLVALGTALTIGLVALMARDYYGSRDPPLARSLPVLTLRHDAVSPDFCDPSSPLSLSGFFGLDGSRYDASRSKRYYYWFFERRSRSISNETVKRGEDGDAVPLILWMNGGPGTCRVWGDLTSFEIRLTCFQSKT